MQCMPVGYSVCRATGRSVLAHPAKSMCRYYLSDSRPDFPHVLAPSFAASARVSPLQSFSGSCLKGRGCIGGGIRSLASCIACPTCLTTLFMLKFSGTMLLTPSNTLHVTAGLVALSSSTAVLAWPHRFHLLALHARTPSGFRQTWRVSSKRFGVVCMSPQGQLPRRGPSSAHALLGFCALVS